MNPCLPEGGWLYARSVTDCNGRIRPLHALIDGKPVYRDEGVYHLRYSLDGKRIWQPIGSDASLAQVALQRKTVELQAVGMPGPICTSGDETNWNKRS